MEYRFSDVVDILNLQQTIDSFYAATGLSIQITDLDNQSIVVSSGQKIFEEFQRLKRSHWRWEERTLSENKSVRRFEYPRGLFKYAGALRVGDQDLATLFLGPVFHEEPNAETFRVLAQEPNFDASAYLDAVTQIPIVPEDQARSYLKFLIQTLQATAEKGLNFLRLRDMLSISQDQETTLRSAYQELESRILERTEELQRTNKALQESEQRFRVALIDTPIVVFNQDLDLRYTWVYNEQGYASQPVVGKTDADLFSVEDTTRLTALKRRVMAAGLLTREEVSVTVASRTKYYDMTLDPLFDQDGSVIGLTCAATDITERKEIEDTLRQTNDGLVRTQKRIEQILHALQSASGSLELDSVLENIVNVMIAAVEVDVGSIYLIDREGQKLICRAIKGTAITSPKDDRIDQPMVLENNSLLAQVFTTGQTRACTNSLLEPGLDQEIIRALGIKSLLATPLKVADHVLGIALLCKTNHEHQFEQEEIELVQGIANSVALAVENARLYAQMRRRLAESESMQRIAKGLLQRIGLDEVLKIVCAEALRLTGATGSAVLLLESDGRLRVAQSAGSPAFSFSSLPVEGSFAGQAFQTESHVWVNLREIDPDSVASQLKGYPWVEGVKSLLVVPLKLDTKAIGVLNILDKPGEITEEDMRVLDLFADQAAIIIEHIRLQHQSEQLAVLEERQRLARELHDSVTQALYSVTLYADAARMAFSAKKWEALETNLQEVRNMAREAMYDMRLLVFELRPFMLESEGLVSALRARLAAVEDRTGLKTEVHVEQEKRLPIVLEEELYRIAQEGLNNVVKHARASEVRINIQYEEDVVSLEMRDNGVGFDPESASQGGGFGLQGINERVQQLGGSLDIESIPLKGTRLRVSIPIQ